MGRSPDGQSVEAIVYLLPSAERGAVTPRSVRTAYEPELRSLRRRLGRLDRRDRPAGRLSTEQERRLVAPLLRSRSAAEEAELRTLREQLDRRMHDMRAAVGQALSDLGAADRKAVAQRVRTLGGRITASTGLNRAIGIEIDPSRLPELALDPRIWRIVRNPEERLALDNSVPSTGYTSWHGAGFSGGVFDSGLVDSGVQESHPAFAGLVFFNDEPGLNVTNGHGTHVAGIIGSGDATFAGTAPGHDAMIWSILGGGVPNAMNRMETMATGYVQSPEVINFSAVFGRADTYDYDDGAIYFDSYVEAYDITLVPAAGNAGWSDVEPRLGSPAIGYNVIGVANMWDRDTLDVSDDVRMNSSSIGPTLIGRRKPDLTAPGAFIRSTNAFWNGLPANPTSCGNSTTADFVDCSGTSMAAPHVAGAIVLLADGGNVNPMSQKAVLINSARWWESNDTESTSDDGPVTTAGPPGTTRWDKSYGWGYIDMEHALFHRSDYFEDSVVPRNGTPTEDDFKLYAGSLDAGERATLVWHRRAVHDGTDVPSTIYGLSDLNLLLYDRNDNALVDWDVSVIDNVHQVASPDTLDVVVKVNAWSTAFAGASQEAFSLATEEGFQEVDYPETFTLFGDWPAEVEPNETFTIEVQVQNGSELANHANELTLILPGGWTLLSVDNSRPGSASGLGGQPALPTVWTVRAPSTPQSGATLTVEHRHDSYGVASSPQYSILTLDVAVDEQPPSPNPAVWALEPFEVSASQLQMAVQPGTDIHDVEYEIDYLSSPSGGSGGADSGWQASTIYTDSGLQPNHEYCYRGRARDLSSAANTTGYTPTRCDHTAIETPVADFGAVDDGSIQIGLGGGLSNLNRGQSGYRLVNDTAGQTSPWFQGLGYWTSSGLSPNTRYVFHAEARNADGAPSPFSPQVARYTHARVPGPVTFTQVTPSLIRVVVTQNGNPGGTEFFFENQTTGEVSGWQSIGVWDDLGLSCATTYQYRIRARNGDGVETAWTTPALQATDPGQDQDGDGFYSCNDDCDDTNPAVHPGVPEVCDGIDQDCNGLVDDGFSDGDGDGFNVCVDCNDVIPTVYPGAAELCDGLDNDCNGTVDDALDADGDGFDACADCADGDPAVYPGAVEVCDGVDQNCNGLIDDGNFPDTDLDGWDSCLDCDDLRASVNPGATEICDGIDNDCSGGVDDGIPDGDGDGHVCDDCNDADPAIHPGAADTCNGIDDDCDGSIDDGDYDGDGTANCTDPDDDADGFRDSEDCLPLDERVWWLPGVSALTLSREGELTRFDWTEPAISGTSGALLYDLVTSSIASNWEDAADCVAEDLTVRTQDEVGVTPSSGSVLFYLVVPRNPCGGQSGTDSAGTARSLGGCP